MSSSSESVKIASTSSPNDADRPGGSETKKKFMNLQTQHGNAMTADEENIVVFGRSFSPIRESSDVVVWQEEIGHEAEDEDDVSTAWKLFCFFLIHTITHRHCATFAKDVRYVSCIQLW